MDNIILECCWEPTETLGDLRSRLERVMLLRDKELRRNAVGELREALNELLGQVEQGAEYHQIRNKSHTVDAAIAQARAVLDKHS